MYENIFFMLHCFLFLFLFYFIFFWLLFPFLTVSFSSLWISSCRSVGLSVCLPARCLLLRYSRLSVFCSVLPLFPGPVWLLQESIRCIFRPPPSPPGRPDLLMSPSELRYTLPYIYLLSLWGCVRFILSQPSDCFLHFFTDLHL